MTRIENCRKAWYELYDRYKKAGALIRTYMSIWTGRRIPAISWRLLTCFPC